MMPFSITLILENLFSQLVDIQTSWGNIWDQSPYWK